MSYAAAHEKHPFPAASSEQPRCLIFDLESLPPQKNRPARITKLGALRPDTGEALDLGVGKGQPLAEALHRLDALGGPGSWAPGAGFAAGYGCR